MDKNQRIFLLIVSSVLILSPSIIFAQGDLITPILCTFAKNLWEAAVAGTVIAWAVVVILFVMSFSNPERVNLAKKGLMVVLIGTVIIMLGASAVTLVRNAMGLAGGGGDVCKGIGGIQEESCGPCPNGTCESGKCVPFAPGQTSPKPPAAPAAPAAPVAPPAGVGSDDQSGLPPLPPSGAAGD